MALTLEKQSTWGSVAATVKACVLGLAMVLPPGRCGTAGILVAVSISELFQACCREPPDDWVTVWPVYP